ALASSPSLAAVRWLDLGGNRAKDLASALASARHWRLTRLGLIGVRVSPTGAADLAGAPAPAGARAAQPPGDETPGGGRGGGAPGGMGLAGFAPPGPERLLGGPGGDRDFRRRWRLPAVAHSGPGAQQVRRRRCCGAVALAGAGEPWRAGPAVLRDR